jgi:hypothetical protein
MMEAVRSSETSGFHELHSVTSEKTEFFKYGETSIHSVVRGPENERWIWENDRCGAYIKLIKS